MKHGLLILAVCSVLLLTLPARGQKKSQPEQVKQVPPPGVPVSEKEKRELVAGLENLGKEIADLRNDLKGKPALLDLLPDVQIYFHAVRNAIVLDEFYSPKEITTAYKLVQKGMDRADELRQGKPSWPTATGLVVRGYVSKIDGSVQPYGLVVPTSYKAGAGKKFRLDFWYHGRGETLTELAFIQQRQTSAGQFTPKDTFVLHPYGRYCNASHLAGEVDTFEALDHARKHYPIDDNRLSVRGFSMGGATTWHMAVHHAGLWFAAAPGAGFAETPIYTGALKDPKNPPPWYEQKLWHLYDCPDYVGNLVHCPVIAYSGEIDKQKAAADLMEAAMKKAGLNMVHIIGPGTEHKYHPDAIPEINKQMDALAAKGRNPVPKEIHFTTWTLRYNKMLWVVVDGLERHWEKATVDAEITGDSAVKVKTGNVTALTLTMPAGLCPLDTTRKPKVILDGQELEAAPVMADRSWVAHFHKSGKGWQAGTVAADGKPRKSHGLQGPIDDAFMDGFVMVRPTGKSANSKVETFIAGEMAHAIDQWHKMFRGEAPVKDDADISADDIRDKNLILWGDPGSNKVLAKIVKELPLAWSAKQIGLKDQTWDASRHVPVLIYPNPLNPKKYVVLNSGFTFREGHYLTNANMVPKLPDWAVYDLDVPATPRQAAGVAAAGFFGERWEVTEKE